MSRLSIPDAPDARVHGQALAAMERNLSSSAVHLHRQIPHAKVSETGDVVIADGGVADSAFNSLTLARFADAAPDKRIADALARVAATGRPYSWWIGPLSTPADLPARLAAAGLEPAGEEPVMFRLLQDLPACAGADGLEIRQVASRRQVEDFAAVIAENWDPPSPPVREFYAAAAPAILAAGCASRLFVGYLQGRPVSTAELHVAAGVAGIYNVVTSPAFRRRGYGSALTLASLHAAQRAGLSTAVLIASPEGEPVYRGLGFETCGHIGLAEITP